MTENPSDRDENIDPGFLVCVLSLSSTPVGFPVLAGLIALLLPRETSLPLLTGILIVLGLSILPWGIYFARIPELERTTYSTRDLPRDLGAILRSGGYLPSSQEDPRARHQRHRKLHLRITD